MLNINKLEQQWLRYKIKSYIPHAIISISLILIFSLAFIFLNTEEEASNTSNPIKEIKKAKIKSIPVNIEKQITNPVAKTIVKPSPIITKQQVVQIPNTISIHNANNENSKMLISPSLDFMKKMQRNTLSNYENYTSPKPKLVKEYKEPKVKEIIVAEIKPEIIEKKSSNISIKRQNTHDDISQVITRFNKNNNPALSLFIAKKYYELGDYRKSYNYALITNEINNEIEASWIVFAKSLVKLQEKEQAIKTLKKYIDHSNSNRANILLDDIISGKFK